MDNNNPNPYSAPESQLNNNPAHLDSERIVLEYVGFWSRVWASLIDTVLLMLVTLPILYGFYGSQYFTGDSFLYGPMDFLFSYVFPAVAICLFWVYRSATPGKMAIGAVVVDAKTGQKPSTGQFIGRYFAYYLSILGLCLGYLWVAWDPRKQGWHDKLAGTVVVRDRNPKNLEVVFENKT